MPKVLKRGDLHELQRSNRILKKSGAVKPSPKKVDERTEVLRELAMAIRDIATRPVQAPNVNVQTPAVNVPPAQVQVNQAEVARRWRFSIQRDPTGRIKEIIADRIE